MLDLLGTASRLLRVPAAARETLLDTQPHPNGAHIIRLHRVASTGCYIVRVHASGSDQLRRAIMETDELAASTLFLRLALTPDPEACAIP